MVVKYNVTDTSSETTLLLDTTPFIDMEIDGVTQPSVVSSYTFNALGIHTVKYTLVDPTTIGYYLLDGIDYLSYFDGAPISEITIPNSVTSIDRNAFAYCGGLTSITIPDSVTSIGQEVFRSCTGLTSVTIPNGVTSIGDGAFQNCSNLTSITIPNSVISMGARTFLGCTKLTTVEISNSVTSIGNQTFNSCSGLTSVTIPNSVTSIDSNAFGGCSGLTSVTIGSGVTSIGDGAFVGCSGLTSIVSLATTAPTISNNTFRNVKTSGTLTVPQGSSGYNVWMSTSNYYLGKYNWTKVEQ